MTNVKLLKYNAYATSDKGVNYRAVCIGRDINGVHTTHWRLCKVINDSRADFVNDTEYNSPTEALSIIDTL